MLKVIDFLYVDEIKFEKELYGNIDNLAKLVDKCENRPFYNEIRAVYFLALKQFRGHALKVFKYQNETGKIHTVSIYQFDLEVEWSKFVEYMGKTDAPKDEVYHYYKFSFSLAIYTITGLLNPIERLKFIEVLIFLKKICIKNLDPSLTKDLQ